MLKQISNPPNPYLKYTMDWFDAPPVSNLEVYEEHSKSIISHNVSPDVGFSYSINPYRGCFHACAYCYARPTHQYLNFGAGTDFERKIVVKVNAAELLRIEFMRSSWKGDFLAFSGVTDCYQPLEASYEITKKCLEVCQEFKNPVGIITKGALIKRDIKLLQELSQVTQVKVFVSLAFIEDRLAKQIEPHAPRPSTRLRTIQELTSAGIEVGIGLAPIIPGLNDTQIPQILAAAKESGATKAFMTLLRLPAEVEDVFIQRLNIEFPSKAKKVLSSIKAMKEGKLNRSDFGSRMVGSGDRWKALEWLFQETCKKLDLNAKNVENRNDKVVGSTFQRPTRQLSLF